MSYTPFRSTKKTPTSFENYFYHIKPLLGSRPLTPTPSSKQFFSNTSHRDRSFHLISKVSQKTPSKKSADISYGSQVTSSRKHPAYEESYLHTEYNINPSQYSNDEMVKNTHQKEIFEYSSKKQIKNSFNNEKQKNEFNGYSSNKQKTKTNFFDYGKDRISQQEETYIQNQFSLNKIHNLVNNDLAKQPKQNELYLPTEYSSQNTNTQMHNFNYSSPTSNIQTVLREKHISNIERSPSIVEYDTEESIQTTKQSETANRTPTNRDLAMIRIEEKSLKEYIGSMETKIKKFQEEERSITKKIEITKKFEDKIFDKRREIENMMNSLNQKKTYNERKTDELRLKNLLEKKLHKENVNKSKSKIYTTKQMKALQMKENKENLMSKSNIQKELEFSEKIVKVNNVINFEKNLKSKISSNISQKGIQIKTVLLNQIQDEREKLLELKNKAKELEKQEESSKTKLEDMKQLHLIKYFKLQQIFETCPLSTRTKERNFTGYTLASTATFDDRKNSSSVRRKEGCNESNFQSSGMIHINTSVISLANNNNHKF